MDKGSDSDYDEETIGPSTHVEIGYEHQETKTAKISVFLTCQRGSRKLFVIAREVFTPRGVEGALPSSSAKQVQVG